MNFNQIEMGNKIKTIGRFLELFYEIIVILKPILENKSYQEEFKKNGSLFKLVELFEEISNLSKIFKYSTFTAEFLENLRD